MRVWALWATFLLLKTVSEQSIVDVTTPQGILLNPEMAGLSIPSQPLIPDRETPSPQPLEQPSSGPNPVFLPTPKRKGRPSTSIKTKRRKEELENTAEEIAAQSRVMQQKLTEAAAEKAAADLKRAEEQAEEARRVRIYASLEALKNAGCTSTYQFFEDFFASTDREISRQASRLLNDHGTDFLDLMNAKRPDVVERWALKTSLPIIAAEGKICRTCSGQIPRRLTHPD